MPVNHIYATRANFKNVPLCPSVPPQEPVGDSFIRFRNNAAMLPQLPRVKFTVLWSKEKQRREEEERVREEERRRVEREKKRLRDLEAFVTSTDNNALFERGLGAKKGVGRDLMFGLKVEYNGAGGEEGTGRSENRLCKVEGGAVDGSLLHLCERDVVSHKLAQSHVERRAIEKKQFESVKGFCPKLGQLVERKSEAEVAEIKRRKQERREKRKS